MALNEDEYELVESLFKANSDACEGCPYFQEYAERLTWLHSENEGMVMCALLGGADGNPQEVCRLVINTNEEAQDNDD